VQHWEFVSLQWLKFGYKESSDITIFNTPLSPPTQRDERVNRQGYVGWRGEKRKENEMKGNERKGEDRK
jgi:hypothetical protein